MTISKIEIENIRGFEKACLNVDLRPNCANILVAPNGFGKSSISTAFNCATGNKLSVDEKDKHLKRGTAASRLSIEYDQNRLDATSESNAISDVFEIHVIRQNIEPKAKLPKVNGFTIAKPYLELKPLDLGPSVKKEIIKLDIDQYKSSLDPNSKVVPNISNHYSDEHLRSKLFDVIGSIDKLKQKKSSVFLHEVIEKVKSLEGTKARISDQVEAEYATQIDRLPHLKEILDVLVNHGNGRNWLDNIIFCDLLMKWSLSDRTNFKKWLQYAVYSLRMKSWRSFIEDINTAWVGAEIKETKGRVLVQFPDAQSLSNGQRDLLYFGCNLLRTRDATSSKPCILVIDEIFDYLDDANIVVAQYFISKLIDAYRLDQRQIYICLLTHLDPSFFKGYALKRQKTVYLGDANQVITRTMQAVIAKRDDPCWAQELSRFFLHYHPDECDLSDIFNSTYGLPRKHGTSNGFRSFLADEWKKCISGNTNYDPFAVCTYVRIRIEQCAYSKVCDQSQRDTFLNDCNGTTRKLEFVDSLGISVPEVCFLLGVIYNDALHKKGVIDTTSTISLKLRNLALQGIMKQAIDW